jgi:hypothetical protein
MFRSAVPSRPTPKGISNSQMEREDRKGLFAARRTRRKARWAALPAERKKKPQPF